MGCEVGFALLEGSRGAFRHQYLSGEDCDQTFMVFSSGKTDVGLRLNLSTTPSAVRAARSSTPAIAQKRLPFDAVEREWALFYQ